MTSSTTTSATLHRLALRLRSASAAAALVAVSCVALGAAPAGAAASSIPTDPNAKGFIGLCDNQNRNVTGGDINTPPFAWKAVASTPPPKSLLGRGQNAVLNIFQPRPNVTPAEWSGDQLTAATFYTTSRAPSTQATLTDIPLSVIIKEYPPQLGGLYQLRMYFGKTNSGLYSATYPATFIRVQGSHWSVVSGGRVNCAASSGTSTEVLTGAFSPRQAYGTATPQPAHGQPSSAPTHAVAGNSTSDATPGSQSPVGNTSTQAGQLNAKAAANSSTRSASTVAWLVAALAVAAAAIAGLALWRTKRRS